MNSGTGRTRRSQIPCSICSDELPDPTHEEILGPYTLCEAYDWEEPVVLEYSSNVMNPLPDRDKQVDGGWSGVLDMKAGDVIEWECHVVNQTDQVLGFSNNTYTGEMCIMDAELVGANCGSSGRGGF